MAQKKVGASTTKKETVNTSEPLNYPIVEHPYEEVREGGTGSLVGFVRSNDYEDPVDWEDGN